MTLTRDALILMLSRLGVHLPNDFKMYAEVEVTEWDDDSSEYDTSIQKKEIQRLTVQFKGLPITV